MYKNALIMKYMDGPSITDTKNGRSLRMIVVIIQNGNIVFLINGNNIFLILGQPFLIGL